MSYLIWSDTYILIIIYMIPLTIYTLCTIGIFKAGSKYSILISKICGLLNWILIPAFIGVNFLAYMHMTWNGPDYGYDVGPPEDEVLMCWYWFTIPWVYIKSYLILRKANKSASLHCLDDGIKRM